MSRRAIATAILLAGASVPAQDSAPSRASSASQSTPLATPSAHPLHRGWLKELLDRDLAGAREAYDEAAHGGGSTTRDQQVLALARLTELDAMLGRSDANRERREQMRQLGAQLPPPDRLPENPAARTLEALRKELAERSAEDGHAERARALRERIAAEAKTYKPRLLMLAMLQQRRPGGRGLQADQLMRQIEAAEAKGNRELVRQLRARRDSEIAEFRTPSWRQRPLRALAIEVVAKRLDKKDASAERAEDLLLEALQPVTAPGRQSRPMRPKPEPREMLRVFDSMLRPDADLQKEERITLQRAQARGRELLGAGKRDEAWKLLEPLWLWHEAERRFRR